MLKLLKRWLGWDADTSLFDFSDLRVKTQRPTPPVAPPAPVSRPIKPTENKAAPPPRRKPKAREPLDVLDNPRLSLDKPADGFDPYNTGAFNRSASWEKIGRQRKR